MWNHRFVISRMVWGITILALGVLPNARLDAKPKRITAADHVTINVKASELDQSGNQKITITLEVEDGFYYYAHELPELFRSGQFRVTFHRDNKTLKAKINYPKGKIKKDELFGEYQFYVGKNIITANVDRGKNARPICAELYVHGFSCRGY